jgi:hypothetical protein
MEAAELAGYASSSEEAELQREQIEGSPWRRFSKLGGLTPPSARNRGPALALEAGQVHRFGVLSLPTRMAARVLQALKMPAGSMPHSSVMPPPPLTQALLLAHTSAVQRLPRWQPGHQPVQGVPRPFHDSQSAEARHRRWLEVSTRMSSASSEAGVSVHPTEISRTMTMCTFASRVTVAGGGKGHSVGRSSRKQLALLLCAIWQQFYDNFGADAASAPTGAELVREVCDALIEIMHVEGIETLLRWHPSMVDDAGPVPHATWTTGSSPHSGGEQSHVLEGRCYSPPRDCCLGAGGRGDGSVSKAVPLQGKTGMLPPLRGVLRMHANVVWGLSEDAAALRGTVASALMSDTWLQAAQACRTWPKVLSALKAAWESGECCDAPATPATPPPSGEALRPQTDAHAPADAEALANRTRVHADKEAEAAVISKQLLLTVGFWSVAALLQLSAVEPRPELWGRYVAALNHLQGVLLASKHCADPRPQGRVRMRSMPRTAALWSRSGAPRVGRFGVQTQGPHAEPETVQAGSAACEARAAAVASVHQDVLALVLEVERHVRASGSAQGGGSGHASAFAKGKANMMSVLKRYKGLLAWSRRVGGSNGNHASSETSHWVSGCAGGGAAHPPSSGHDFVDSRYSQGSGTAWTATGGARNTATNLNQHVGRGSKLWQEGRWSAGPHRGGGGLGERGGEGRRWQGHEQGRPWERGGGEASLPGHGYWQGTDSSSSRWRSG